MSEAALPEGFAAGHWTEEVRLAMAWNGGVSLAIWMGGVAVELDAARRAPGSSSGSKSRSERLYQAICAAFQRTLEIDILCGASAGGLNAALLAAAIESRGELEANFLRKRWLAMGDFESLLQPIGNNQPAALMRGQLFFEELQEVFAELLADAAPEPEHAPARVLLDVQVTDVVGKERSFVDDWSELFYAREYRAPVRFRTAGDYTPGTLAAASRASASFPGAFEAQRLNGRAAHLAGFPDQERWAIDGGVLENAPIRQAIDLIPTRRASGPVKRFVCYVDADPETHKEPREEPTGPQLATVLSDALTLPRKARLVDQLQALEDARRRGGLAGTGIELLDAGPALADVAKALLPTYQKRRALLSLSELLDAPGAGSGPGLAHEVLRALGRPEELPWIPRDFDAPAEPHEWRWGVRAGQRVLQLQLDVLARALQKSDCVQDAAVIFDARAQISAALAELDGVHRDFTDPQGSIAIEAQQLRSEQTRAAALVALGRLNGGTSKVVLDYLLSGTAAFGEAIDALSSPTALEAIPSREKLFGAPGGDAGRHFIELALAAEVIRRSFSDDFDIELGQELHVAQLTPTAPTLLFTATPLSPRLQEQGPATPEEKLTGIRFGHFGAFYRSSWRANDFMWGRLDGASHAVRLLVDADRARVLQAHGKSPWKTLAEALVPESDDPADADQRQLVSELLLFPDGGGGPSGPAGAPVEAQALRAELEERIREDLTEGPGELTRAVCTRAVQYEAFAEEAPRVSEQADLDRAAGAYDASLGWQTGGRLWNLIGQLRDLRDKSSLPQELGRDSGDESASSLAARTISHAAIVALNALTGVVPFARNLQPARVPLFAVQGVSARRMLDSMGVVIGFTGAAWYLAARYLTLPRPPKAQRVPLGALWSVNSLVLWVSLLVVIGVVVMPALRAIRSQRPSRRVRQGACAIALAAVGGGVALGWQWDLNGSAVALTSSGASYAPPEWLLWLVAAVGGFHVASQLESVSKVLAPLDRALRGNVSAAALLASLLGGMLAGFTMVNAIWPALDQGGWKTAISGLAWAAPVLLVLYMRVWERPLR